MKPGLPPAPSAGRPLPGRLYHLPGPGPVCPSRGCPTEAAGEGAHRVTCTPVALGPCSLSSGSARGCPPVWACGGRAGKHSAQEWGQEGRARYPCLPGCTPWTAVGSSLHPSAQRRSARGGRRPSAASVGTRLTVMLQSSQHGCLASSLRLTV